MHTTIHRDWHPDQLACTITTGRRWPRGTITTAGVDPHTAAGIWIVRTHTGGRLPDVTGDYLDAEQALLAATRSQDDAEQQRRRARRARVLPQWGGPLL